MSIETVITKTSGSTNQFPAMATGLHAAVIRNVKDLGEKITKDDRGKEKITRTFLAEFVNAKGEQAARFYTPSLFPGNERTGPSNLASDLNALDGAVPDTFVMKSLIGRQVQVLVDHYTNAKGYPAAKVLKVMPAAEGQNVAA
jgi:hypothetical protein